MGTSTKSTDDGPQLDPRIDREQRPPLGPAIISGGCAVLVALITGLFNWVNNRPGTVPTTKTPTLTIEPTARTAVSPHSAEPVRTADIRLPTPQRIASPSRPLYGLNFAQFQAAIKESATAPEARQQVIDSLVGHTVIWQGYVRSVSKFQQHGQGWEASVELVESPAVLTQAGFHSPAHCRFLSDPGHQVAKLQRGDLVTISGEFVRHDIATEVTNCHLTDVFYSDANNSNAHGRGKK